MEYIIAVASGEVKTKAQVLGQDDFILGKGDFFITHEENHHT